MQSPAIPVLCCLASYHACAPFFPFPVQHRVRTKMHAACNSACAQAQCCSACSRLLRVPTCIGIAPPPHSTLVLAEITENKEIPSACSSSVYIPKIVTRAVVLRGPETRGCVGAGEQTPLFKATEGRRKNRATFGCSGVFLSSCCQTSTFITKGNFNYQGVTKLTSVR